MPHFGSLSLAAWARSDITCASDQYDSNVLAYGDSQAFLCSARDNTRWEQSAGDSLSSLFKSTDLKRVENSCVRFILQYLLYLNPNPKIFFPKQTNF